MPSEVLSNCESFRASLNVIAQGVTVLCPFQSVLPTKMPGELPWAPKSSPQTFPLLDQCYNWTDHCGFNYNLRCPSAINIWKLWRQKVDYLQALKHTRHVCGHTARSRVGRVPGHRPGLGFCFNWCQVWGPMVFGAHYLLVNLNHKSRGREKQVTQMVSYQNQDLQHKGASVGRVGLAVSSPVPGHVLLWECLHWSGCLGNQSLHQALVLQHLRYNYSCIFSDKQTYWAASYIKVQHIQLP